jgi:imidazole glycerol-phosphate synthase subunit HisF
MLPLRIIPCLDVKNGRVVKGTQFVNLRDAGDPVERAALYAREGADELVFLDITASSDDRELVFEYAARVAEEIFIPYCVGGGIRTVDDFRRMLKTGADKVSVNSAAVATPDLIRECSDKFGAQCVVVAIDPKRTGATASGWEVHIHGGRTPTGIDALDWALKMEQYGAGEILLTSMDRDGAMTGYDIALTEAVTDLVGIPVIASGGAGSVQDIADAYFLAGAQAALIASLVHDGHTTCDKIKSELAKLDVPVRLTHGIQRYAA